MKCRDMNPGNRPAVHRHTLHRLPSMKCRDMNPGNSTVSIPKPSSPSSLNEVPGYESRQFPDAVLTEIGDTHPQ